MRLLKPSRTAGSLTTTVALCLTFALATLPALCQTPR